MLQQIKLVAIADSTVLILGKNSGARKLKDDANQLKQEKSLGDCVDCNLCVEVCPTGIDIRNGM